MIQKVPKTKFWFAKKGQQKYVVEKWWSKIVQNDLNLTNTLRKGKSEKNVMKSKKILEIYQSRPITQTIDQCVTKTWPRVNLDLSKIYKKLFKYSPENIVNPVQSIFHEWRSLTTFLVQFLPVWIVSLRPIFQPRLRLQQPIYKLIWLADLDRPFSWPWLLKSSRFKSTVAPF